MVNAPGVSLDDLKRIRDEKKLYKFIRDHEIKLVLSGLWKRMKPILFAVVEERSK